MPPTRPSDWYIFYARKYRFSLGKIKINATNQLLRSRGNFLGKFLVQSEKSKKHVSNPKKIYVQGLPKLKNELY